MTLYLSDLDGTLLNYAAKLKPRSAEMLNRLISKGVLFSFATARRFATAGVILKNLNLNTPVITMNGAILVDPASGERISTEYIPEASIEAAKEFIIKNNETPIVYSWYEGKERVAFLKNSHKATKKFNDTRKGDPNRVQVESYDELFKGGIYYFTFLNPISNVRIIDSVFSNKNGFNSVHYTDTYENDLHFYEAFSVKASKAIGALKVKELTGASKIIAFGDNLNDIPMFKIADECYAVQNAHTDLKKIATGIIASNEEMGVPVFIEKRETTVWDYTPPISTPERFKTAIVNSKSNILDIPEKSNTSPISSKNVRGIGEISEKSIHAALKYYFSKDSDREIKIGSFVADVVGENGIYEIQTASWGKLNKKLDKFLDACHVTIVYPFEQRVRHIALHEKTGELLKRPTVRNNKNFSKFFYELYAIKSFLTHPNLTICLCGLEIEQIRFIKNPDNPYERRQKKNKNPIFLLSEIYLENSEDYRMFLPKKLPEQFSIKDLGMTWNMMEVLEYMSVIHKCGKKGNLFLYCL